MSTNYSTTTTQRATSVPNPQSPQKNDEEYDHNSKPNGEGGPIVISLRLSSPFNFPPSPESAAVRILKNLETLALYYATFLWTVLFIALIPRRNVSIVYLVSTTEVAFLYYLLLRAFPNSALLQRVIDRRVVFFLLFLVGSVGLVMTRAAVHLFVVLGLGFPLILAHAVLTKRADEESKVVGERARAYETFV